VEVLISITVLHNEGQSISCLTTLARVSFY